MARVQIPKDIEADVLFHSNHRCSICGKRGINIHHIDSNKDNNKPKNLMVVCVSHHDEISSKSTMSKGYTRKELEKYRDSWHTQVEKMRDSLSTTSESRLIRFDGKDTGTVFLEVEENTLRAFQDRDTFEYLGFNWGNVDIFLEEDKKKFNFGQPLTKLRDSRKIRVKFQSGALANEVFVIWDDGRKHFVPDPETLNSFGGFKDVEDIDYLEFNTIGHGRPILDIFTVNNRRLLMREMKNKAFGGPP
ncbi:MAG TPA: HNH endonuclease signature motif containing protein [Candidatus Saccharimonadales bacterium]|nr:HNH endonuclease signature motif containing protein [Candidatus Saccharimonadales bacterium]